MKERKHKIVYGANNRRLNENTKQSVLVAMEGRMKAKNSLY